MEAKRLPRWWAAALVLGALCLSVGLGLAAGSSAAEGEDRREGDLSPRLAELATPEVRSAPPRRQAKALSVPVGGAGSLLREGNRVLVEVRFDQGAAAGVDDLRADGAKVVGVSPRYQVVTVAARPDELRELSTVPGVTSATEVLAPITYAAGDSPPAATASAACVGGMTSEGDVQLGAAAARAAFGVDGSGQTVGVLSDSYDQGAEAQTHAAGDVASGDLPGNGNPCNHGSPVAVLDDSVGGEDEGRAMAQIVHDLAPGAKLAFATAFGSELAFANNIRRLAAPVAVGGAGADVIVDDVSYFNEPFFQEGPIAVAVQEVSDSGVSYFSSAGNNNLIAGDGRSISSWEAPGFRLSSCPTGLSAAVSYASQCMDFEPGPAVADPTFGITVKPGVTLKIALQWAEPWNGVETDLDLYLLDESGDPLIAGGRPLSSEQSNVANTQQPFEFLAWRNEGGAAREVQVAISRYTGEGGGGSSSPRVKLALMQNGGGISSIEYPESSAGDVVGPAIFGHNGAAGAISVGAVPFHRFESPEDFSSLGPVTHYFGPVLGTAAAQPLGAAAVLAKPDVVATDGGANTFFGACAGHTWRFFGTSAAAPHAAAVAALARQAAPGSDPAEIAAALLDTARPVGVFAPFAVGRGLLDAPAAIARLRSAPSPPPSDTTVPPATQNC
jgi:Subtilase family